MRNSVSKGVTAPYVNDTEEKIVSGQVVPLASGYAVATVDIEPGAEGEILLEEVVELEKSEGVEVEMGQELFFDEGDQKIVLAPAADAKFIGVAHKSAASADTVVHVKLLLGAKAKAANIAALDTVNGSDAGTTQTLANATKAKLNDVIAALKAAGIMVAD